MIQHKNELVQLYREKYNRGPELIQKLPISGSSRLYYRLSHDKTSVIGAYNADVTENLAFFSFTGTFSKHEVRVPGVWSISGNKQCYLLQDLGSQTVAEYLTSAQKKGVALDKVALLKGILTDLVHIQLTGGEHIDFSKCYPRESFDAQSLRWDLNYFKYEFLKLIDVPFDEQKLEDDFDTIVEYVGQEEEPYFMYRDFQLRNIMWHKQQTWFIDYQGGRRGPLQYDLASLLLSPTTGLNENDQKQCFEHYLHVLSRYKTVDLGRFEQKYNVIALVRIMQALGAYGYRGLYQHKTGFSAKIAAGISNLKRFVEQTNVPLNLPELKNVADYLESTFWAKNYILPQGRLIIKLMSFSYKRGIPRDPSENGGGFVFDCRGIANPYRVLALRPLSGLDQPVVDYLDQEETAQVFAEHLKQTVKISIDNYIERGFQHLCIYFGCTGGQHRSVYNAEKLGAWIKSTYDVDLTIAHREELFWKREDT